MRIRSESSGNKAYRVQERTAPQSKDVVKDKTAILNAMIKSESVQLRDRENVLHKQSNVVNKSNPGRGNSLITSRDKTKLKIDGGETDGSTTRGDAIARSGTRADTVSGSSSQFISIGSKSQVNRNIVRTNIQKRNGGLGYDSNWDTNNRSVSSSGQGNSSTSLNKVGNPFSRLSGRQLNNSVVGKSSSKRSLGSSAVTGVANYSSAIPDILRKELSSMDDERDDVERFSDGAKGAMKYTRNQVVKKSSVKKGRNSSVPDNKYQPKRNVPTKGGRKSATIVKKTSTKAKSAGKTAGQVLKKSAIALVKNPAVLKVIAVVLIIMIVVILIILAFSASTISNTASVKHLMDEELYKSISTYIRDKDKELLKEYEEFENQPKFADIEEENVTKKMKGSCSTRVIVMTSYLYAKYEDGLTLGTAKQEIDRIHSELYKISYTEGEKTETSEKPALDKNGKPKTDKQGNPVMETVSETKRTLTVTLDCKRLDEYIDENLSSVLPEKTKQDFYEHLLFTAKLWGSGGTGWGMPFENDGYNNNITCHFGGPDAAGKPHRGTDFGVPSGVEILAVLDGTVIEVSSHPSWGNTVLTENEDGEYRIRYAHMSGFNVSVGDTVGTGDVIGFVGSTGFSTGPHLHLEVQENGALVNALDYISGDE